MSSTCKTENVGFKYIWKIENFSKCALEKGESLTSPKFAVGDLHKSGWYLRLYPRGIADENYLECILTRESVDGGPTSIHTKYFISLITTDETDQEPFFEKEEFKNGDTSTCYCYQLRAEIFKNRSVFLPKDTMTILCYIQKHTEDESEMATVECIARTRISVERIHFTWNINNFFSSTNRLFYEFRRVVYCITKSKSPSPIIITLRFSGKDREETSVNLSKNKNKPIYVNFKLLYVDVHKKLHDFCAGEHFFRGQDIEWVPFSTISRKLFKNKGTFVANNTLSIQCEFELSFGVTTFEIEKQTILPQAEPKNSGELNRLMFNLRDMYIDQKFCDVSFRIGNRTLRAHKLILCARSPVFSAMFDSDMKETSSDSVDIDDLDFDTVNGMLMFLYTDALEEDLGFESALKLYEVADKYQIESLKEKCLGFLGTRISVENFCDVLVVADMHRDERLMDVVKDFMVDHLQEIMKWSAWKELMENNFVLGVETLHQVLNRSSNV